MHKISRWIEIKSKENNNDRVWVFDFSILEIISTDFVLGHFVKPVALHFCDTCKRNDNRSKSIIRKSMKLVDWDHCFCCPK